MLVYGELLLCSINISILYSSEAVLDVVVQSKSFESVNVYKLDTDCMLFQP